MIRFAPKDWAFLMIRTGFLFAFLFLLFSSARADELTLHFVKSPTRTTWDSPRKLAFSAIKNLVARVRGGKRHSIGHVYVELQCGLNHTLTGVTSDNDREERRALFLDGYGLGVILRNSVGKFDAPDEAKLDLESMQATGRSNFIRFLISSATCSRLTEYLKRYEELGYQNIYGNLNARPLLRQSSGCSAFGMSFLELSGLQAPEFEEQWMTHRILPRHLVGGHFTHTRVRMIRILTERHSHWDNDLNEGGFAVDFWDPEKMHHWVEQGVQDLEMGTNRTFPWPAQIQTQAKSKGLVLDTSTVLTPTGPFFRDP
jgi:hypothetical protein